jgi:hypothetical protein
VDVRSVGVRALVFCSMACRRLPLNSARASLSPLVFKTVPATFTAHGSSSRLTEQFGAVKVENPAVSPVLPASRGIVINFHKSFEPDGRRHLTWTDPHAAAGVSRHSF